MTKLASFSAEMRKIAKVNIPSSVLFGGIGAGVGAVKGFGGALDDQWQDNDRLRSGLISRKEWKDRRDYRTLVGLTSTATLGATGALTPTLARRLRNWLVDSAKEAAKPLGDQFEASSGRAVSYAKEQVDQVLDRHTNQIVQKIKDNAAEIGVEAGKGIKTSLKNPNTGDLPIHLKIKHRMPWQK